MTYKDLFKKLQRQSSHWQNEEEVRQGWIIALTAALQINFHAERGKKDSSYNNVVIEFKDKGRFRARTSSPAFKEAIYERLLPYIISTARKEGRDQSDYIGIAIDADHICFAQIRQDQTEHGHLLPLSETFVTMVATALKDSFRRTLIADNLIEDFGHASAAALIL